IAYATEDRKRYGLNLIEDIQRNVSAAGLPRLARRGWVNEHAEHDTAQRYRRDLRIKAPSVRSVTGKLSGGNQQKVVLAKWIFTDPDVLILDEPTRGIDVGAKYEIYSIVGDLAAQGKAVLVISSELPELLGLCDRIYTLSDGRITGVVARANATKKNLMQYMTKEPQRPHWTPSGPPRRRCRTAAGAGSRSTRSRAGSTSRSRLSWCCSRCSPALRCSSRRTSPTSSCR